MTGDTGPEQRQSPSGRVLVLHVPADAAPAPVANTQVGALTARLGYPELADRVGLDGDLLLTGTHTDGQAADVPTGILDTVERMQPSTACDPRASQPERHGPLPAGLGGTKPT